jgi:Tfp pilus assembly protein PilW
MMLRIIYCYGDWLTTRVYISIVREANVRVEKVQNPRKMLLYAEYKQKKTDSSDRFSFYKLSNVTNN